MTVSTGADTLDAMLGGGYPEGRSVLVTGTPGTGKSTLSMQFLQAGLDEGERCLFVSTEQTPDELRDSFSGFSFDLDHSDLAITTLHAEPSQSVGGKDALRLRTLHGGSLDSQNVEFTPQNVIEYLRKGGTADRVVVDSVSGLEIMSGSQERFRRSLLDMIRLFSDDYGATTLFTAEYFGQRALEEGSETLSESNAIQHNTHGVLRLWRERVSGDYRRYIDVMKMRGVDHDTREYELIFDDDGVRVEPGIRRGEEEVRAETVSTDIEGLDGLLGGGITTEGSTLLKHDGRASLEVYLSALISSALDRRMSIVLMPRVNTSPGRLDALFERLGVSLETVLDRNQLFILDALGGWSSWSNVYDLHSEGDEIRRVLTEIREAARGNGLYCIMNTEAEVNSLGADTSRELAYWLHAQFLGSTDVLFDVHNPDMVPSDLAAFFEDAATQVLRTWTNDNGLEYVKLEQGLGGRVGEVRLAKRIPEAPYFRLEQ